MVGRGRGFCFHKTVERTNTHIKQYFLFTACLKKLFWGYSASHCAAPGVVPSGGHLKAHKVWREGGEERQHKGRSRGGAGADVPRARGVIRFSLFTRETRLCSHLEAG